MDTLYMPLGFMDWIGLFWLLLSVAVVMCCVHLVAKWRRNR